MKLKCAALSLVFLVACGSEKAEPEPSVVSPLNEDGTCARKPFGAYTFESGPPICREGETASSSEFSIAFGARLDSGATGTLLDGETCLESWKGCSLLLTCEGRGRTTGRVFDLVYHENDTFAGKAVDGCTCYTSTATSHGSSYADCDVTGTK